MAISIADAFLTDVRNTLQDPSPGSYWTDAELIGYYNVFVTAAISEKQDALTKTINFTLAAGVDQVLPDDGVQLLGITSNVPAVGVIRSSVKRTTEDAMQDADPTWYSRPPTSYIRHYCPHKNDPLRFKVWPPSDGTGHVYLSYAYAPAEATSPSDNFGLTEAYRNAAYHFVLSKAFGKGDKNQQKSAWHQTEFKDSIRASVQAEAETQAKAVSSQSTE